MSVCCGGILGLGENVEDRLKMIEVISEFNPQPESVPINPAVFNSNTKSAKAVSASETRLRTLKL